MEEKKNPRALLLVHVRTIHPYDPNDPESRVETGEVNPIVFEIHDNKKLDSLPPGMISDLRGLLSGVVKHCRTYTPTKPEEPSAMMQTPKPANDVEAPKEREQLICARCGWRELECGCDEGFLLGEEQ